MNPKTFKICLCRPLGLDTFNSYIFYLHAEDHHAALNWVNRVFVDIDIKPTLYRWSGGKVSTVGNSDPVRITNCDAHQYSRRIYDKNLSTVEPGKYRCSLSEIADEFEKLLDHFSVEQKRHYSSFYSIKQDYEKRNLAWQYEHLLKLKHAIELSTIWTDNLRIEYELIRPRRVLVMPQKLHIQTIATN